MARLADHPYIVSVITAGVTAEGGRPYLVMRYCPPPDLGIRVRSNPMSVGRRRGHRDQARQRDRDRAPLGHPAPRHQAEQRAGDDLPRARAHRLRHRGPHGRRRGRERRPHLLPVVASRAARRPVQRLGRLRRLLPRRHDLAPAGGPLAVLDPVRRQLDPGPERPHPARRSPGHPASRRAPRPRPTAPAVPGQAARAPAPERPRAGPQPPADRVRRRLVAHGGGRRGRPSRHLGAHRARSEPEEDRTVDEGRSRSSPPAGRAGSPPAQTDRRPAEEEPAASRAWSGPSSAWPAAAVLVGSCVIRRRRPRGGPRRPRPDRVHPPPT